MWSPCQQAWLVHRAQATEHKQQQQRQQQQAQHQALQTRHLPTDIPADGAPQVDGVVYIGLVNTVRRQDQLLHLHVPSHHGPVVTAAPVVLLLGQLVTVVLQVSDAAAKFGTQYKHPQLEYFQQVVGAPEPCKQQLLQQQHLPAAAVAAVASAATPTASSSRRSATCCQQSSGSILAQTVQRTGPRSAALAEHSATADARVVTTCTPTTSTTTSSSTCGTTLSSARAPLCTLLHHPVPPTAGDHCSSARCGGGRRQRL